MLWNLVFVAGTAPSLIFIMLENDSNVTSLHRCFSVAAVLKAQGAKAPLTKRDKYYLMYTVSNLRPHYFFNTSMILQLAAKASHKNISKRPCFQLLCIPGAALFGFTMVTNDIKVLIADTRFSSSSTRWKSRQGKDSYAREAKVQGLKSRAAFKLLEVRIGQLSCYFGAVVDSSSQMDAKYKLFKKGQTVVDLVCSCGMYYWHIVLIQLRGMRQEAGHKYGLLTIYSSLILRIDKSCRLPSNARSLMVVWLGSTLSLHNLPKAFLQYRATFSRKEYKRR